MNSILPNIHIYIFYRVINKEKKEKKKKWKAQMREAGEEIIKVRTKKMAESTCEQRIVLDMSYDDMMSDKVLMYYILQFNLMLCLDTRVLI